MKMKHKQTGLIVDVEQSSADGYYHPETKLENSIKVDDSYLPFAFVFQNGYKTKVAINENVVFVYYNNYKFVMYKEFVNKYYERLENND